MKKRMTKMVSLALCLVMAGTQITFASSPAEITETVIETEWQDESATEIVEETEIIEETEAETEIIEETEAETVQETIIETETETELQETETEIQETAAETEAETELQETEAETEEVEVIEEENQDAHSNGLFLEDGEYYYYVKGAKFTGGFKTITTTEGTFYYYFQKDGKAYRKGVLNFKDKSGNTVTYYFHPDDGKAYTAGLKTAYNIGTVNSKGEITVKNDGNKYYYYFQKNGKAAKGVTVNFTKDKKDYTYYFQNSGKAFTDGYRECKAIRIVDSNGNLQNTSDGNYHYYYFQKNGQAYRKGLLKFTDADGKTQTCYFQPIDGQAYTRGFKAGQYVGTVTSTGSIKTVKDGKNHYFYFLKDGKAYKRGLLNFTKSDKNYTFYFDSTDGEAFTGGFKSALNISTVTSTDEIKTEKDGKKHFYYFQTNGQAYKGGALNLTRSGKSYTYYFHPTTGEAFTGGYKSAQTVATADASGKITKVKDGNTYYYYFLENGIAYTAGFLKYTYKSKTYYSYFKTNGQAATDMFYKTKDSKGNPVYYYFGKDGRQITDKLQEASPKAGVTYLYYFGSTGKAVINNWATVGNDKYYFNHYGHAVKGLNEIDDENYFFNEETCKLEWTHRAYQNPSEYYQIQDNISLSGGGYTLSIGYMGLKTRKVIQYFGISNGVGMGGAYYSSYVASQVKAFQQRNGLSATGNVDLATWKAMGFTESQWYTLGAYSSPVQAKITSTKEDLIEIMIDRAYDYLYDDYVIGASGAPGEGIDCSGLCMQAMFAAGIDTSPINPVRHAHPGYEYESQNLWDNGKFKHVSYSERRRGDIIIYEGSSGAVIHSAIYLGDNEIIESWPNSVQVSSIIDSRHPYVKGVLRVFN